MGVGSTEREGSAVVAVVHLLSRRDREPTLQGIAMRPPSRCAPPSGIPFLAFRSTNGMLALRQVTESHRCTMIKSMADPRDVKKAMTLDHEQHFRIEQGPQGGAKGGWKEKRRERKPSHLGSYNVNFGSWHTSSLWCTCTRSTGGDGLESAVPLWKPVRALPRRRRHR